MEIDWITTSAPYLWLQANPQWLIGAIVLIAFIESFAIAGIIVPGVALLFALAVLAGSGALSVQWSLAAAYMGAVLGDGLSFLIGYHYSGRLKTVWPFYKYQQWLANGERFFTKHGGKSVFIGRFVGPIRPVMPLIAGMMAMPMVRFFSINILSALGWAPIYILPGYAVGASMSGEWILPKVFIEFLISILAIIFLVVWLVRMVSAYLNNNSVKARLLGSVQSVPLLSTWLNKSKISLGELLALVTIVVFMGLYTILRNTASSEINALSNQLQQAMLHPVLDQLFITIHHWLNAWVMTAFSVILFYLWWRKALIKINQSVLCLVIICLPSVGAYIYPIWDLTLIVLLTATSFLLNNVVKQLTLASVKDSIYIALIGLITIKSLSLYYLDYYNLLELLATVLVGLLGFLLIKIALGVKILVPNN